ncbi:hypothetical protein AMTRI_Chr09g33620 [Amborella trichopoda]
MDTRRKNSSSQLLEEIEALSSSLYQSHRNRRAASLSLPSTDIVGFQAEEKMADSRERMGIFHKSLDPHGENLDREEKTDGVAILHPSSDQGGRKHRSSTSIVVSLNTEEKEKAAVKGRSRRTSLSPWRSRPKPEQEEEKEESKVSDQSNLASKLDGAAEKKKGIWKWKPVRALSHMGMQKFSLLFSVEVVTIQGLSSSMNGLRMVVRVRKQETREGAVQTMPARVLQGCADFEETLFIKCHVYGSGKSGGPRFESRLFLVYAVAVDAEELDFGRNCIDLSLLVQESLEKSFNGGRVRQWDANFPLSGKAKGGELVLRLGFQIMERDGGIFSQMESSRSERMGNSLSSYYARKQSKNSFSVSSPSHGSPRINRSSEASTPSQNPNLIEYPPIEHLNLDEPKPSEQNSQTQEDDNTDNGDDMPEFDVVEKGIEIPKGSEEVTDKASVEGDDGLSDKGSGSSEVVKEVVVHDPLHQYRLNELDSIAKQIKALESMFGEGPTEVPDTSSQGLDADEETVTREFLQMLEEEEKDLKLQFQDIPILQLEGEDEQENPVTFLPDLGKGLGPVVQTKDGGFLASVNPLNLEIPRQEAPKLAMQVSKPFVLPVSPGTTGFEVLQKMAAMGVEPLISQAMALMSMDDITGKTAEQVAFEGIASAIISGRNKEGASSSAARSIASVKKLANAMSASRKERITTGIWNSGEEPEPLKGLIGMAIQKIEAMALEGLKIQAEIAEEEPPFDVSPLIGKGFQNLPGQVLSEAICLTEWTNKVDPNGGLVTLVVLVILRDPVRRFEQVGAPFIVLVQATSHGYDEDGPKLKVGSVHLGGLKVRQVGAGKRHVWDSERQRLGAAQWLVANGLGKQRKGKPKQGQGVKGQDLMWSISARVVADMWLQPTRNPEVKFPKVPSL